VAVSTTVTVAVEAVGDRPVPSVGGELHHLGPSADIPLHTNVPRGQMTEMVH
jgi:hypothetical protein